MFGGYECSDIDKFDLFVCMDSSNISNLKRIIGDSSSIIKLLDRDVADPWYTGNFKVTYNDIVEGIDILINKINSSL